MMQLCEIIIQFCQYRRSLMASRQRCRFFCDVHVGCFKGLILTSVVVGRPLPSFQLSLLCARAKYHKERT
jgi:hypothetical protein